MEAIYVLCALAYFGIGGLLHTKLGNDFDGGFHTLIFVVMWPIVIVFGVLIVGGLVPLYIYTQFKENGWWKGRGE